jgi:hypothetical protein
MVKPPDPITKLQSDRAKEHEREKRHKVAEDHKPTKDHGHKERADSVDHKPKPKPGEK